MGKQLAAIIHRNWHIVTNDTTLSTIVYPNLYQSILNPTIFITTLFTLHKYMALQSKIHSTTTPTHPHTPIQTYPQWYTHGNITIVVTHLFPYQYRTHPTHLDAMDNEWNVKTSNEDLDIIQRQWGTPTPPHFWCQFGNFSYALLILTYLVPII